MPQHYDLSRLKILLVDDCRFMRTVLSRVLQMLGIKQIEIARDGLEAFDMVGTFHPDIIILDWEMVPMNGPDFVRRLRLDEESPNPYLPVIMVTGYTERRKVEEARDAGITEFLAKPVSTQGLYSRLIAIIENPRPFIRTRDFFGPDRRRVQNTKYDGPERRVGEEVVL